MESFVAGQEPDDSVPELTSPTVISADRFSHKVTGCRLCSAVVWWTVTGARAAPL